MKRFTKIFLVAMVMSLATFYTVKQSQNGKTVTVTLTNLEALAQDGDEAWWNTSPTCGSGSLVYCNAHSYRSPHP